MNTTTNELQTKQETITTTMNTSHHCCIRLRWAQFSQPSVSIGLSCGLVSKDAKQSVVRYRGQFLSFDARKQTTKHYKIRDNDNKRSIHPSIHRPCAAHYYTRQMRICCGPSACCCCLVSPHSAENSIANEVKWSEKFIRRKKRIVRIVAPLKWSAKENKNPS